MVGVAPNYYIAGIAAVSRLPDETIYWNNSKTFGKYGLFTYENM